MASLSEKDEELCTYLGVAGSGLGIAGFFQIMVVFNDHWLKLVIGAMLLFCTTSFIFLIRKSRWSFLLILVSAILLFLYFLFLVFLAVFTQTIIFSLVITLFFIYTIAVVTFLYITGMQQKLRLFALEKKREQEFWNDK